MPVWRAERLLVWLYFTILVVFNQPWEGGEWGGTDGMFQQTVVCVIRF